MDIEQLARDAFYGLNDDLYERLCWAARYTVDGIEYPANGLSLAECIVLVAKIAPAELVA